MAESPSLEQVLDAQNKYMELEHLHWRKYELFTFQFWLLVAMLILPWLIWWKLVDRKRLLEILIYGLLISTIATVLDEVGCQLNLWEYRIDLEPLFPRLIAMNFAMLPVWYMLVYQYFTKWKPFIIANIISATIFTFIGEPLFVRLGIYEVIKWKHIYSFPIYIILAIIFKALVGLIIKAHRQAS